MPSNGGELVGEGAARVAIRQFMNCPVTRYEYIRAHSVMNVGISGADVVIYFLKCGLGVKWGIGEFVHQVLFELCPVGLSLVRSRRNKDKD